MKPPTILTRDPKVTRPLLTTSFSLSHVDRVANIAQELAGLQDKEDFGPQVAQLVTALNTRGRRYETREGTPPTSSSSAPTVPRTRAVPAANVPVRYPQPMPTSCIIPNSTEENQKATGGVPVPNTAESPEHPYLNAKDATYTPPTG